MQVLQHLSICFLSCTKASALTLSRRGFASSSSILAISGTKSMSSSAPSNIYWNREISARKQYDSSKPVIKEAKIVCISDPNDDSNSLLYKRKLPDNAKIIAMGSKVSDFDIDKLKDENANVIFCSHARAREPLAKLLQEIPSIEWVHARSAGIDHLTSETLSSTKATVTNAKGSFSSTLAESSMMAISYFAKDLPRLLRQKKDKNWEKYSVLEIRGAKLGIIGYGDIGKSTARLAKAYGMTVKALRRNVDRSKDDPFCDEVYPSDQTSLNRLFKECDYVLCAAPLTDQTRNLIGEEAFRHGDENTVFINVGRGPIVDENALIDALKNGKLKGASLDVFAIEPLPKDSMLWDLDNVLISPHNMDQTETFMHEAAEFFVEENLPRFSRGEPLLNPTNPALGY
jgi:phosphoglycerate dehydrogenase-like enzyme